MDNLDIYDGELDEACKKIYEHMEIVRDETFTSALSLRDAEWLAAFGGKRLNLTFDDTVLLEDCILVPRVSLTKDCVQILSIDIIKP